MRRWLLAGALVAIAVFAVGRFVADLASPRSDAVAAVQARALQLARANGEAAPRTVRMVSTKERVAVAAFSGARVASNRDVYAVAMTGTFVGRRASRIGRDVAHPRGSVLVAAFDARTLALVYWGVTDRRPQL